MSSLLLLAASLIPFRTLRAQTGTTPSQLPSATTAEADVYHLHGVVLDSHTGKPIARALVHALGDRLATFTDHDGRFALDLRLADPGDGRQNPMRRAVQSEQTLFLGLAARKPGYAAGKQQIQSISLSALGNDFDLRLTPESVIQGRIAASGDDHPEGVQVSLLFRRVLNGLPLWNQMRGVPTNSRGEFRFGDLEPGEYKLQTQQWSDRRPQPLVSEKPSSRYSPVYYPAGSAARNGASLHLTAGESLQVDLNLHAETFYPVHIPVVLPAGSNSVQERILRAGVAAGFNLGYNTRDHAVEGMLPSGSYEIILETYGQEPSAAATPLTVEGAAVQTALVTLLPTPSIPVIVHEELTQTETSSHSSMDGLGTLSSSGSRRNLPVQQVMLLPRDINRDIAVMMPNKKDPDSFTLGSVPPGTYDLQVLGGPAYVAAATCGGIDLLRQPLVVTSGSGSQPIEITVRDDFGTVTGTIASGVVAATDTSSLYVYGIPTAGGVFQRLPMSRIRAGAAFQLRDVPPGSYRIFASHQTADSLEYRSETWMQRNAGKGVPITLQPGQTASVTLSTLLDEEP